MTAMLAIVMLSVLVVGGAALQCYECSEQKANGVVVFSKACNDANKKNCPAGQNACIIATMKYTVTEGTESTKMEEKGHDCVVKSTEDDHCKKAKEYKEGRGAKDFECSAQFCETDLCNAGHAVQVSFLVLAATIGLFGLFF
jgi:hypothetical protein